MAVDLSSQFDSHGSSFEEDAISITISTPLTVDSSVRFPSQLKSYGCPYETCSKAFNRPARLTEHLRSHTNTRPFTCPHSPCTKDFLRETHLNHHVKSAHTDVRDYSCEWESCGKRFLTSTRLKRHLAAHEGREKYRCGEAGCGQTFRKHGTLQKHTTLVHEGKKPFVCKKPNDKGDLCGVGFDTTLKLKSHESRFHCGTRYSCTICSGNKAEQDQLTLQIPEEAAFSTYTALQAHNKTVHPPRCDECGYQCGTAKELSRHIEIQHGSQELSERQTHLCLESGCGRGFTKKGNLIVHMRTVHIGEKRFICGKIESIKLNKVNGWSGENACGKDFTSKGNLEEHVRTVHMGLKVPRKGKENVENAQKSPKKGKASVMARLTGVGYEEASGYIACLVEECDYRFMREYDHDIHLQSTHGLADLEIQGLRAEKDGYGMLSNEDTFAADLDAERAFDELFAARNYDKDIGRINRCAIEQGPEEAVTRGKGFWMGGSNDQKVGGDSRDLNEVELRRLIIEEIREEDDIVDEMMIDPMLR